MNKLLKDAIADAKAVRETALANAKVALEEAFAPKLQSMLSHKIMQEMEDDTAEEEPVEPEEKHISDEEQMEAKKMKKMAGMMSEEDDEEDSDDAPEMPAEDMPEDGPSDMPDEDVPSSDDDELEEILRELEADVEQPEDDEAHGKINPAGLPDKGEEEDYAGEKDQSVDESEDPEDKEMDEEIDLEEIIKALREEDEAEEAPEKEEAPAEDESSKEELAEAYSVIKFLRSKLNEVNLLNAKLLYVNKLFRKGGQLTESQKVKIIETFDRAKNVREAKLIYATLSESMVSDKAVVSTTPKKRMNEGLASAPQKKTNKILNESNNIYNRFKALVEYNNNI